MPRAARGRATRSTRTPDTYLVGDNIVETYNHIDDLPKLSSAPKKRPRHATRRATAAERKADRLPTPPQPSQILTRRSRQHLAAPPLAQLTNNNNNNNNNNPSASASASAPLPAPLLPLHPPSTPPSPLSDQTSHIFPPIKCRVCLKANTARKIICCSLCRKGIHTFCLNPPVMDLPSDTEWKCLKCRREPLPLKKEARIILRDALTTYPNLCSNKYINSIATAVCVLPHPLPNNNPPTAQVPHRATPSNSAATDPPRPTPNDNTVVLRVNKLDSDLDISDEDNLHTTSPHPHHKIRHLEKNRRPVLRPTIPHQQQQHHHPLLVPTAAATAAALHPQPHPISSSSSIEMDDEKPLSQFIRPAKHRPTVNRHPVTTAPNPPASLHVHISPKMRIKAQEKRLRQTLAHATPPRPSPTSTAQNCSQSAQRTQSQSPPPPPPPPQPQPQPQPQPSAPQQPQQPQQQDAPSSVPPSSSSPQPPPTPTPSESRESSPKDVPPMKRRTGKKLSMKMKPADLHGITAAKEQQQRPPTSDGPVKEEDQLNKDCNNGSASIQGSIQRDVSSSGTPSSAAAAAAAAGVESITLPKLSLKAKYKNERSKQLIKERTASPKASEDRTTPMPENIPVGRMGTRDGDETPAAKKALQPPMMPQMDDAPVSVSTADAAPSILDVRQVRDERSSGSLGKPLGYPPILAKHRSMVEDNSTSLKIRPPTRSLSVGPTIGGSAREGWKKDPDPKMDPKREALFALAMGQKKRPGPGDSTSKLNVPFDNEGQSRLSMPKAPRTGNVPESEMKRMQATAMTSNRLRQVDQGTQGPAEAAYSSKGSLNSILQQNALPYRVDGTMMSSKTGHEGASRKRPALGMVQNAEENENPLLRHSRANAFSLWDASGRNNMNNMNNMNNVNNMNQGTDALGDSRLSRHSDIPRHTLKPPSSGYSMSQKDAVPKQDVKIGPTVGSGHSNPGRLHSHESRPGNESMFDYGEGREAEYPLKRRRTCTDEGLVEARDIGRGAGVQYSNQATIVNSRDQRDRKTVPGDIWTPTGSASLDYEREQGSRRIPSPYPGSRRGAEPLKTFPPPTQARPQLMRRPEHMRLPSAPILEPVPSLVASNAPYPNKASPYDPSRRPGAIPLLRNDQMNNQINNQMNSGAFRAPRQEEYVSQGDNHMRPYETTGNSATAIPRFSSIRDLPAGPARPSNWRNENSMDGAMMDRRMKLRPESVPGQRRNDIPYEFPIPNVPSNPNRARRLTPYVPTATRRAQFEQGRALAFLDPGHTTQGYDAHAHDGRRYDDMSVRSTSTRMGNMRHGEFGVREATTREDHDYLAGLPGTRYRRPSPEERIPEDYNQAGHPERYAIGGYDVNMRDGVPRVGSTVPVSSRTTELPRSRLDVPRMGAPMEPPIEPSIGMGKERNAGTSMSSRRDARGSSRVSSGRYEEVGMRESIEHSQQHSRRGMAEKAVASDMVGSGLNAFPRNMSMHSRMGVTGPRSELVERGRDVGTGPPMKVGGMTALYPGMGPGGLSGRLRMEDHDMNHVSSRSMGGMPSYAVENDSGSYRNEFEASRTVGLSRNVGGYGDNRVSNIPLVARFDNGETGYRSDASRRGVVRPERSDMRGGPPAAPGGDGERLPSIRSDPSLRHLLSPAGRQG